MHKMGKSGTPFAAAKASPLLPVSDGGVISLKVGE